MALALWYALIAGLFAAGIKDTLSPKPLDSRFFAFSKRGRSTGADTLSDLSRVQPT
jgi:hypothetical protein